MTVATEIIARACARPGRHRGSQGQRQVFFHRCCGGLPDRAGPGPEGTGAVAVAGMPPRRTAGLHSSQGPAKSDCRSTRAGSAGATSTLPGPGRLSPAARGSTRPADHTVVPAGSYDHCLVVCLDLDSGEPLAEAQIDAAPAGISPVHHPDGWVGLSEGEGQDAVRAWWVR